MNAILPINKTLVSLTYNSQTESLAILFRKGQTRTYHGVPITTAYKLAYSKDASALLHTYATEIKKKFKVTVS